MCEVLNGKLLEARDKPIITALEYIREYCMRRIVNVCKVIEKSSGPLTPTATLLLEQAKKDATRYVVQWGGGQKYQVSSGTGDQYVVDVVLRKCSCRKWEITGLPCRHAVATNWFMALNREAVGLVESWVHPCYWLDTWKQVYSFKVEPINGSNMWFKSPCPTNLSPPLHHTQPGRPKKKRRRSANESEPVVKSGNKVSCQRTVSCSKCGNMGHNSRSCTGQGGIASTSAGKKKGKAVKKNSAKVVKKSKAGKKKTVVG